MVNGYGVPSGLFNRAEGTPQPFTFHPSPFTTLFPWNCGQHAKDLYYFFKKGLAFLRIHARLKMHYENGARKILMEVTHHGLQHYRLLRQVRLLR